jgi:hypothetical protein
VLATATVAVSTTYATRAPSGETAGPATGPGPLVSRIGGPPDAAWRHRQPSTALYTTPLPSGSQSKAPPP